MILQEPGDGLQSLREPQRVLGRRSGTPALAGEAPARPVVHDAFGTSNGDRSPDAAGGLGPALVVAPLLVVVAAGLAAWFHAISFLYALYIGAELLLGAICWTTLVWMLDAWRTPGSLAAGRLRDNVLEPTHFFSLIVAARHEEAVLEATLSRLIATDHPAFEVLVVVGVDDGATRAAADRVASRHPGLVRVILDDSWPKSKPNSLNLALPHCRGTVVGVFDAEDDVHPALLDRVDECFQTTDADVVQAGVQLMNFRSSWWTVRNVLEYYFWFRSRLHFHARQRFIPLGGNTVFIRTQVLRAAAGWDADCLAEDCELGVRLSALGARTVVVYEPGLVTREECPPTLRSFARQRTRWNQGYLQTLSKGYWRRLPFRQRALGAFTLATPYLLGLAWVLIPAAVATAILVNAPILVTMVSFLPALPMLSILAVEVAALGDFCKLYGERASLRDYVRLIVGLPVYQAVLAYAAARAVVREARGKRGWEKTAHLGLHLGRAANGADGRPRLKLRAPAPRPARRSNGRPLGPFDPREALLTNGHTNGHANGHASALPTQAPERPLPMSVATALGTIIEMLAEQGEANGSAPWPRYRPAAQALRELARELEPDAIPTTVTFDKVARRIETDYKNRPSTRAATLEQLAEVAAGMGIGWQPLGSADGAGGANGWPHNLVPGTWDPRGNEPLWRRLRAVSVHGSGALALPRFHPPRRLTGTAASRLRAAYALVRGAVASRADVAVVLLLLVAVGLVQATNMLHWPAALFDEGTYVGNAWAVPHGSLAPYTYTYGHPPLAWLFISVWTWASGIFGLGGYSIDTERELMLVVSLISCALVYTLGRRLAMGRVAAAVAVLLFALSPLSVYFHRAVLLDNPAVLWALAAFVLALTPRRRLWAFAASGACFAASVLCKETTFVLLPALVLAAAQNADPRTRRYCLTLFGSFLVMIGVLYPLYATLKGELIPGQGHVSIIDSMVSQLVTRQATGSVFDPHSTSHATVMQWLGLDPWLLAASLVLAPIALARRRTRAVALALIIQALMILRPGYLPAMYVIGLLPFAALVVAGSGEALWRGWRRIPSRIPRRVLAVAAVALVVPILIAAGTHWTTGDEQALTLRADTITRAAERWLVAHLPRDKRVIVDDQYWVYLVTHGFNSQPVRGGFYSRTVVSYWPLDYDPAVKQHYPQGWRNFDYIISTEPIRDTPDTPTAINAIKHSKLIITFGGAKNLQRVEVRQIITAQQPR